MIVGMSSLNFADMVVTFLALLGPQKVLLAFGRIARTLDGHSLHVVIVTTAAAAICIGVVCDLAAPWLATFFHISNAGVQLAGGLIFFVYALCMVLGIHFDVTEPARRQYRCYRHRGRRPTRRTRSPAGSAPCCCPSW